MGSTNLFIATGRLLRRKHGTSMSELLIVIAILAILAAVLIASLNFLKQLQKARDAGRKSDLSLIQKALEEYYTDKQHYLPADQYECGDTATALQPYLDKIPCDPKNTEYHYQVDDPVSDTPKWYKLYTNFETTSDPVLETTECSSGCAVDGLNYNYYVSSPNASF